MIRPADWFTLAVILVAALPVLVVLVEALASGWAPDGDRATTAVRAFDVFSSHTPLVGPYSSSSALAGVVTYHPGPLLFWLLAVPAHLPGLWALPTTIAALNAASIVGSVLLARRRGGLVFMVVVAASIIVMLSSLPTDLPNDIWNPSAPVLPFMLLVIVGWSVACGQAELLPLAVFLVSFIGQCHIAYLPPGILVVAVGVAGLLMRRRFAGPLEPVTTAAAMRRWVLIAVLVGVVCWTFPIVDQILGWTGRPGHGNLGNLINEAGSRGRTFGIDPAIHAIVRTVGVVPWWLRRYLDPGPKTFEVLSPVSRVGTASTMVLSLGLVVGLLVGWRRRRLDVVSACALAAALIVVVGVFTASFPDKFLFNFGYTSWWVSPAGMWIWLLLGWSAAALAPLRRPARVPAWTVLPGVTAAALLTVPLLGLKTRWHGIFAREYPALRAAMDQVATGIANRGPVLVVGRSFGFDTGIVFALRRKGLSVGSPAWSELGTAYKPTGRSFAQVLTVNDGISLPNHARLVARVTMYTSPPRTVTVGLLSAPQSVTGRGPKATLAAPAATP